ncbi:MAG TPA: STAS domain-containing protein [Acidimicrobiales bacterium]|nr:STAS domain-containing protein [Acidimicrobiales bacterium]
MSEPHESPVHAGDSTAPGHPGTLVVVVDGRIDAARVRTLVGWVRGLLDGGGPTRVVCDVAGVTPADADAVDALARLALMARRRGVRLWVRDPSAELCELFELVGLTRILPVWRSGDPPVETPPAS